MCKKAVEKVSRMLEFVPEYLKTQAMSEGVVEDEPGNLEFVSDNFKTQTGPRICSKPS